MRRLIYIPIIHSEEDMGSMAGPLKQEFIQKFGLAKWRHHVRTVDSMWEGIMKKLNDMELNYKKVKIYQDGLPLCGKELEIMEDVARLGSHNYKIIAEMVKNGASLLGTEDARLLIEEYNFIKNLSSISDVGERKRAIKKAAKRRDELIKERDKYIANRIKDTLKIGETGVLFTGLEHEIDKYLPKYVKIEYLIYRLPFKEIHRA